MKFYAALRRFQELAALKQLEIFCFACLNCYFNFKRPRLYYAEARMYRVEGKKQRAGARTYRAEGTFNRAEGKKQRARVRMQRAEGTFNRAGARMYRAA